MKELRLQCEFPQKAAGDKRLQEAKTQCRFCSDASTLECNYKYIYILYNIFIYIYILSVHTYINPITHPHFVCNHSINSCVSENCKDVKHGWVRGQTRQLETNQTNKQGEWESEMTSCWRQRQQTTQQDCCHGLGSQFTQYHGALATRTGPDLQAGDGGGRRHQTLIQQGVEGGVARKVGGAPVDLHVFRQVLAGVLQLVFIQNDIKHILQVDTRQSGGDRRWCRCTVRQCWPRLLHCGAQGWLARQVKRGLKKFFSHSQTSVKGILLKLADSILSLF